PPSECSSGPRRTSPPQRTAVCRWERHPTSGRTVTYKPASRTPRWSLMKRSSHQTRATRRSRPAVPWLTGRTERFTFTPVLKGRAHHRARHVRYLEQRSLRCKRRCPCLGPHRVAPVPTSDHALAWRHRSDEYPAQECAELAWWHAGDCDYGADHRESSA